MVQNSKLHKKIHSEKWKLFLSSLCLLLHSHLCPIGNYLCFWFTIPVILMKSNKHTNTHTHSHHPATFFPSQMLMCFTYSFFFFFLFTTAPAAYGSSWARGQIEAAAAGLCQSLSNASSLTH